MKMKAKIEVMLLQAKVPKDYQQHQKLGESYEQILPHSLKMNQSANTLISKFWTPEWWDSKFLLC